MTRFLCPLWNNIRLTFKAPPAKKVAVVVPLSSRPGLTEEEEISLAQLRHYLSGHDFHLLAPEGLPVDFAPEFTVHRLDDKYFGSGQAHALLQLSAEFYERFIDYEYIFIYHLDALVFSDELLKWCDAGYDFIGAPWLPGPDCPWIEKDEEAYSGNSGFCLMNVRSFLRVLYSTRCRKSPGEILKELKPEAKLSERLKVYMKSLRQLSYFRNNINMHIKLWLDAGLAADLFWANHAKHYYPRFRVARTSEALPFAFETRPRDCFEMNGNKLPFGCHAWGQFDPEFWQPYLVTNKEPAAV